MDVGGTWGRQGNGKKARELIRLALELDGENSVVLHRAGLIARRRGRTDQAEDYFRKALAKSPKSAWFNECLGLLLLEDRSDVQAALPYAGRACELEPKDRDHQLLMARCLMSLGRFKEAEPHARKAATVRGGNDPGRIALAQVLEKLGRYEEAAKWCMRATISLAWRRGDLLEKAANLYDRAGKPDKAMEARKKFLARGYGTPADKLKVARYLATRRPTDAAALCYAVIAEDKPDFATRAGKLLQEMGMPLKPPLLTGPVFDITALRKMGVRALLQPYEGFRFSRRLAYLQVLIEDSLGVPVVVGAGFRPVVAANYYRQADLIRADSSFAADLRKAARAKGAIAGIGLTSIPLKGVYATSWCAGHEGPAICTTYNFEPDTKDYGAEARLAVRTFPGYLRLLMKQVAQCSLPAGDIRCLQCTTQQCSLGAIACTHLWERELPPCASCRPAMQAARKNWPKGPEHRPPIVAGPAEPAVASPPEGKAVLVIGLSALIPKKELDAVARCVAMSIGLRVKTRTVLSAPSNMNRSAFVKFARQYVGRLRKRGQFPAAVCLISPDSMNPPHGKGIFPWEGLVIPAAQGRRPCPTILIGSGAMPDRLKRRMPASHVKDGKVRSFRPPQYAKAVVGALASLTSQDYECWTYGCPSTVWEGIGIPHRCSYWLCPKCRKAISDHYLQNPTGFFRFLPKKSIATASNIETACKNMGRIVSDRGQWDCWQLGDFADLETPSSDNTRWGKGH